MNVKTLPEELARTAVRGALAATSTEPVAVRSDIRDLLVRTLARALAGPAALSEYLAILAEEARRSSAHGRTTPVLESLPLDDVMRRGVGVLSDADLVAVATSPETLRSLERAVERADSSGELGEVWEAVYAAIADDLPPEYLKGEGSRRLIDEILDIENGPRAADTATRSASARRIGRRIVWQVAGVAAIAASLLLAFFLGRQWSANTSDREVRLASVTVRGEVTRGIEDIAIDVTNGTDRRVFLTFVGLVPGRKTPAYHYRQEGRYIEIPPRGTTAVANLPPEFEGTTVLLVFSTPVPAGGVIREVTPAGASPDTAQRDAELIKKALADLSIDSDVKVVFIPIAKR